MDIETLKALVGTPHTVREFLGKWGYRVRNAESISRIRFDLDQAGLTTDPPFTEGSSGTVLTVLPVATVQPPPSAGNADDRGAPSGREQESVEATAADDQAEAAVDDLTADSFPRVALRVDDLPSARTPVVSIGPNDSVHRATHLMMSRNFSQIPVLDGDHKVLGVVTWKSLTKMYASKAVATLANAMEKYPETVQCHQSLLGVLDQVYRADFALVRDDDLRICGIVTIADFAMRFGELARHFFVIGEIERRLRSFLAPTFDGTPTVKKIVKRSNLVEAMTFGHYKQLLEDDGNWRLITWPPLMHRELFLELLGQVGRVRNKVAHFRTDTLTDEEIEQVDQLLTMLTNLGS